MSEEDLCDKPKEYEWAQALYHNSQPYYEPLVRRLLEHEGLVVPSSEEGLYALYQTLIMQRPVHRSRGGWTIEERERGEHYGKCSTCRKPLAKSF